MAGAGFKTFNTGDVLTASDVNTYLMQQTVMVFASSAARTTALGANVAEGMLSYLKDTDVVEVYNGSAWVSSDDPNAIQNSIVDAKGDIITATANDTPARLAVGITNGQVLTVDSSTATGLKWDSILAGTSFTPTLGGVTVGNGTNVGRYILQNKLLYVEGKFTLGSTSSITGQVTVTLPASKSFAVNNTAPIGFCRLEDTGTAFYAGNVVQNSTTAVALQRFGVTGSLIFYGSVDATNPFTWGNTDAFSYCFTCEVA